MPRQRHPEPPRRRRRPLGPSGSVINHLDPTHSRLTLGAWSWAGIAGILATFDTDLTNVEPDELRAACHSLARRFGHT